VIAKILAHLSESSAPSVLALRPSRGHAGPGVDGARAGARSRKGVKQGGCWPGQKAAGALSHVGGKRTRKRERPGVPVGYGWAWAGRECEFTAAACCRPLPDRVEGARVPAARRFTLPIRPHAPRDAGTATWSTLGLCRLHRAAPRFPMDDKHAKSAPGAPSRTARLFRNGRNQAVRPAEGVRARREEVYIDGRARSSSSPQAPLLEAYFEHGRRLSDDFPEAIEDVPRSSGKRSDAVTCSTPTSASTR